MYWLLDYAEQENLRQRMIRLQSTILNRQPRDQSEQIFPFIGRKSRAIARTLIENLTDEGAVVADPFGGSGIFAYAALDAGRHVCFNEWEPYAYKMSTAPFRGVPSTEEYCVALRFIAQRVEPIMNAIYKTRSTIGVFTHVLLPLHKADLNNNPFEKAKIVKEYARIYKESPQTLTNEHLCKLQSDIDRLSCCWENSEPTCIELLRIVHEERIFHLSKDLEQLLDSPPSDGDEDYQKIHNLSVALDAPFSEVERYWEYIHGEASFDTHQGVKGLEFERVLVIIDDSAARGNTFSYSKLFGVEPKSATDAKNEMEGKETTLDRTRRLLYVICSRAKDSLAIVYYTDKVEETICALSSTGLFSENEIEKL